MKKPCLIICYFIIALFSQQNVEAGGSVLESDSKGRLLKIISSKIAQIEPTKIELKSEEGGVTIYQITSETLICDEEEQPISIKELKTDDNVLISSVVQEVAETPKDFAPSAISIRKGVLNFKPNFGKSRDARETASNQCTGNVPLPASGVLTVNSKAENIAPLRIQTGSEAYHYFLKITDWDNDKTVQTLFVRANSTVETKLPLGSYRIKYAGGKEWQGEKLLFGDQTEFFIADKKFDFVRKGNQISGYAIELILQPGGNLGTRRITPTEW